MSSACTCHINPEYCWWCMYEEQKREVERLRTINFLSGNLPEQQIRSTLWESMCKIVGEDKANDILKEFAYQIKNK